MGDQDILDEFVAENAEDGLSKREREEIRRRSRKLKDASVNLAYARMAVRFVKQKVALVANWDESVPSGAENIYRVGSTPRDQRPIETGLKQVRKPRGTRQISVSMETFGRTKSGSASTLKPAAWKTCRHSNTKRSG